MSSIPKKCLIDALTVYKSVLGVNEKVAIDIKSNHCMIDVNNDILSMRISFNVDKQTDSKAQLVVEADRLLAFMKGATSDVLSWQTKKTHVLSIDRTKMSMPISMYPVRSWNALNPRANPITITSAHLFAQIAKTITPFSSGGHHGALDSICIRRNGKELEVLGTDGFRIGVVHITDDGLDELHNIDIIVPNHVLDILARLAKSDEPCSIFETDKLFRMEVQYNELLVEVAVSPVLSTYPNIQPLLAKIPDHEWEVSATELIQYCGQHRTVCSNRKVATAQFTLYDDKITLHTEGDSEMNSVIKAVNRLQGTGNHSVNLSLRFIMDAINLIALNGSERIRLGISTKSNLIWLRADSANASVKTMAVVVPIG